METNRRPVVLEFRTNEILQDLRTIAYNEGESVNADLSSSGNDSNGDLASLVQDIAEDSNIDRVTRVLDICHAECVELLYPYTKNAIEPAAWEDDTLKESKVYRINMLVPSAMSQTTINILKNYVHEFFVTSVLADWFGIHYPKSAAKWAEKAEDMKSKVQSCTISRMNRVRRSQTPF